MRGYVHLYEGDGKGKTTAAMGLAIRAFGQQKKVVVTQFLKGLPSGEITALEQLGIPIFRTDEVKKFVFQMSDEEKAETLKSCQDLYEKALTEIRDGAELLIMDEVLDAINCGLLTDEQLLSLLDFCKNHCEVVLTGRNPSDKIINHADYYTKMTAVKHPYEQGLPSRKGIEF